MTWSDGKVESWVTLSHLPTAPLKFPCQKLSEIATFPSRDDW